MLPFESQPFWLFLIQLKCLISTTCGDIIDIPHFWNVIGVHENTTKLLTPHFAPAKLRLLNMESVQKQAKPKNPLWSKTSGTEWLLDV